MYFPDFQIDSIKFEVKSGWVYDNSHKNIQKRVLNNLKWIATLKLGFRLILVWDSTYFSEVILNDFKNLEDDMRLNGSIFNQNDFVSKIGLYE